MKDPSSIECQREIYEQTCKNGSDNATNCTSSFRCSRNENPCQNDALCIKVNRNKTYCVCPEFFRGPTCDDIYCDAPCDTRYGHCAINNKCQCTAKHKKGLYCNETVCPLNEKVCQNGGNVDSRTRHVSRC
ncbi:hypothetical protein RF11_02055 [Thelohanellus kitauei]|uniref:EGF-like domain-containing protein n=1 Tax=Thelohanellus kitauei TaxID=669202 RepID=A0A0C2MGW2_THEKT|nr:hypothetical protein RF11_02055 [Thelohanellus kitauei]